MVEQARQELRVVNPPMQVQCMEVSLARVLGIAGLVADRIACNGKAEFIAEPDQDFVGLGA